MTRRIRRILLVCNNYDRFALEEDGRIDTRIANEYIELNLSYPPVFTRVETTVEALALAEKGEEFDLVLTMFNVGELDVFEFSHRMKVYSPNTPIVLLTSYSKEIYRQIEDSDTSCIDHVFCWNNSPDLIIAIIKLLEDELNADTDILENNVQAILLVEDSVRFYSAYLPPLYKLILQQNSESIKEALNEQQQILRKRSRPKVLLATNYEDAVNTFNRYKDNILGVISDVGFVLHKGDKSSTEKLDAGVDFCKLIRKSNPRMPILMQSSQESMREVARTLKVGFVVKKSKILIHEISDYISHEFGFGDFVLTDKTSGREIARAQNLRELEKIITTLPEDKLEALSNSNYMSKWLKARGLFALSHTFEGLTVEKDGNISNHRKSLMAATRDYRISESLGVVAKFDPENYDDSVWFARVGNGNLGGKARGLAFLNSILPKHSLYNKWEGVRVLVPRTIVITTDYFDRFIMENGLKYVISADVSDAEILSEFVSSSLPEELMTSLRAFVRTNHKPLAIRSSSLLEDSYFQPFAGVYSTYMIPSTDNEDQQLRLLSKAIKSVYASVFFASSRSYIVATGNMISEEKMAIIIQEICGSSDNGFFFPTLSGVARSLNYYPIGHEQAEDGVVKIAYGLGKAVVDGEQVLRFTPKYPKHVLQTSTPELTMKETQQYIFALNLQPEKFKTSVDDAVNMDRIPIRECSRFRSFKDVVSTWDNENMRIVDSAVPEGPKFVTFAQMLKYGSFPIADISAELLRITQLETKCNVEIEFACNIPANSEEKATFNLLQVRPISADTGNNDINWDEIDCSKALLYSTNALGTGWIKGVDNIVYLKKEKFDTLKTSEIAREITAINTRMRNEGRNYVLVGYGRWGSTIPSLGIPVQWGDISEAKVIVECNLENFRVEPSQGTHFFQNLTSFSVGYVNVDSFAREDFFDQAQLDALPAESESEFVRVVRLEKPLSVCIDGRGNKAAISL